MIPTHYSVVLTTTGKVGHMQTRPVFEELMEQGYLFAVNDVGKVPGPKYTGLAPDSTLAQVHSDEATLDVVAAHPDIVEMFRGPIEEVFLP